MKIETNPVIKLLGDRGYYITGKVDKHYFTAGLSPWPNSRWCIGILKGMTNWRQYRKYRIEIEEYLNKKHNLTRKEE